MIDGLTFGLVVLVMMAIGYLIFGEDDADR
jgi:hypothetical protein